ncbi:hypothetical protein OA39_00244 [Vibrio campbellii]|uniref:Autotransporter domain-containing protein n=1 Tax=Vibrio campbellii TaxID=680 RepID=A0ACC7R429_9VIBR|nr:autotransporter domain-containing protein [Vibrio campbellii]APX08290.1 hypothetical protein BWP24_19030 [Vibrio campbellii]ARR09528.1 hypothetical protein Vc3S01_A1555 [Vibrio campbellii]KGR36908.1 hypothetical protein OA39_00244 [Vibrio campbellii]MCR9905973.1 autotransporter domain-containing protein [Vibrio campbellii]NIY89951.1 hypothetical protein [Vibrio campbellii]
MTITSKRILALTTLATLAASGQALAEGRNNSIEAGATFVGDHEMFALGYSRDVGNNIVTGGGFFIGNDTIDMSASSDQDAWGMYANVGYRFEIAEFDIIPKIGLNYFNADVDIKSGDHSGKSMNIDNVYASIGGTVNWRMIGLTVDYGKINDSTVNPITNKEFEEDVVRATVSFNF